MTDKTLFRVNHGGSWYLRSWVLAVGVALAVVLFVAGVTILCVRTDRWICGNRADALGLEWEHRPWADGCYVSVDGGLVPIDQRRWVSVTGDGS